MANFEHSKTELLVKKFLQFGLREKKVYKKKVEVRGMWVVLEIALDFASLNCKYISSYVWYLNS